MHDILCSRKGYPQNHKVDNIGGRSQPRLTKDPQADLQQHTNDRKIQSKAEPRLSEKQTIPIGLHGPQRERQVGQPEDNSRATAAVCQGLCKIPETSAA